MDRFRIYLKTFLCLPNCQTVNTNLVLGEILGQEAPNLNDHYKQLFDMFHSITLPCIYPYILVVQDSPLL